MPAGPTAKMAVLRLRWQNIDFDQAVADGVVFATHNRGSIASGGTRYSNLRLLRVRPIVVS